LNELRSLVQLFKPRDLYPCVEDPEKLTYLDLEGCFGDLCDLSECEYLKQRGTIVKGDTNTAIQKILQERWSSDDLDEHEDEEGEDGRNSTVRIDQEDSIFQSRNPSYSIVNELFDRRNRSPSLDAVHKEFYDSESASDTESVLDANNETLLSSPDVIFRDDQIANAELVEYFYDVASKGGNIILKSVCGEFKEDVL
jgi:hypothetical protein